MQLELKWLPGLQWLVGQLLQLFSSVFKFNRNDQNLLNPTFQVELFFNL